MEAQTRVKGVLRSINSENTVRSTQGHRKWQAGGKFFADMYDTIWGYSRYIFMCFFGRLGNKNYAHLEPSEKGSKRISAKRWTQTKEELSSLNVSRGIRSQYVMLLGYFWSNTERKLWWKWKISLSAYTWESALSVTVSVLLSTSIFWFASYFQTWSWRLLHLMVLGLEQCHFMFLPNEITWWCKCPIHWKY